MATMLIIIGLSLDILGAILIAHAIFIKSTDAVVDTGCIRQQDSAEEFYGGSRVYQALQEKFKTKAGLAALVVGFLLQIVANTDLVNHAPLLLIFCVSLVLGVSTYLFISKSNDTLYAAVELADRICQRTPHCTVSGLSPHTIYHSVSAVKHGDGQEDGAFVQKVMDLRARRYNES